jgi:arylformamidase
MTQRILDISPTISRQIAVWPGDVNFQHKLSLDMTKGDNITLSAVTSTLHVGAHADAPNHYQRDGAGIGECALEPYFGLCQVITVSLPRDHRIKPEHIKTTIKAPRVLFKTSSFPNPDQFNEDFNSLSPELIEYLHEKELVLVGIDTPSIDPFNDKILESHQAIARTAMRNLEGLVLSHVEDALYTLVALPLKIAHADASPVRAVLIID